ncbi:MAG TPA: S53 family peptidase [Kofleriaceae bacterium]
MHPRLALVVAAALAAAFCPTAARAEPRAALHDHRPAWATPDHDLGAVTDTRLDHVTVWLARTPERERAFAEWRTAQATVGSPHYHQWLTPAQLGERFGASDAQLAALTGWLKDRGFTVVRVGNARNFVELAGSTSTAEAAFGVQFHRYTVGNAVGTNARLSIDREPTLPASLASLVAGVTGLSELAARPQHGASFPTQVHADYTASDGTHVMAPADFTAIYDLAPVYAASLTGTGQTIGIIGRSRVLPADITEFAARMNVAMSAPTVIVPPTGVDPGAPCGTTSCNTSATIDDQLEATLDVQRAGSVAPGAALDLIISKSTATEDGLEIALQYAIDQYGTAVTANVLSLSFAECETTATPAATAAMDALFQQAAAQGQTVLVASGDSGAAMCDTQNAKPPASQALEVNYFCSSSAVTCVGGTELVDPTASDFWNASGSATGYIPEGAWNEPGTTGATVASASGGGASQYIARPAYQTGLAPATATGRLVPDVSFSAAAHDGYLACMAAYASPCSLASDGTFTSGYFYGTSAAAPSMAAVMALVDQAAGSNQGAANAQLYELATGSNNPFHDVTVATSGVASCALTTPSECNNSTPGQLALTGGLAGYAVGFGFDLVTGWGSPDVASFVARWPGLAVPALAIDPGSIAIPAGGQATVALQPTGFVTATTFSCAGAPDGMACTFSTDDAGHPTMTIGPTTAAVPAAAGGTSPLRPLAIGLGAMLVVAALRRRRALVLAATLAFAGCYGEIVDTGHGDNAGAIADDAAAPASEVTVTATGALGENASAVLAVTVGS